MPQTPTPRASRQWILLACVLVLAGLVPLIWPADVPWINDEPALLGIALRATQLGQIPVHGLMGSLGVPYGPVPVLLYMAGLGVTHDLVWIVVLRVVFFMVLTGGAVWWMARTCRQLDPLIGGLAMLSPYLWFYSRLLWDNSFLIPFSALTLAACVSFSRAPAAWKLWLVGVGAALMLQTHLMCAPLLAAIALNFAWQHRAWARRHKMQLLPLLLIGSACAPYLRDALGHSGTRINETGPSLANWLFPLFGGKFLSAIGLDYFFGEHWQDRASGVPSVLLWTATVISVAGIVGLWLGLAAAARQVSQELARKAETSAEFHLAAVAGMTLVFQMILNGVTRTGEQPHYYNATWFCVFVLVWLAYSSIRSTAWRRALAGGHALSLLIVTLALVWNTHRTQGNTSIHFGPTLGTQMAVLDELSRYHPESEVLNETAHYGMFPQAFVVLQDFHPVRQDPRAPMARLHVRQAEPGTDNGRLTVVAEDLPSRK